MNLVLLTNTFFAFAIGLFATLHSLASCSNINRPHDHSFLYDNFPQLREQAAKPAFIDDDETLLAEVKNSISPDLPMEEFMFNECFLQEGLLMTKAKSTRLGDELLAVLADVQMTRHKATKSRSAFHELIYSCKLVNPDLTVLEDFILSTMDMHHSIQEIAPDPNYSAVVFLGRSPCLYQVAMEELSKKYPQAINLPLVHILYSGHADALSKRAAKLHHGDRGVELNMITEDKLNFYMAYLSLKKLPCYKQLFLVDIIGTGGGIRSWLGLLETLVNSMGLSMPKVHLFVLTPFVRTIAAFNERTTGFYIDETRLFAYSSPNKKIIFDENKELNVKAMEVDVTPIHISTMTQHVIDYNPLQRHCTHGFFFPAQMWTDEGYAMAKKGGDCHNKIYAKLRSMLDEILDVYLSGLQQMESTCLKRT